MGVFLILDFRADLLVLGLQAGKLLTFDLQAGDLLTLDLQADLLVLGILV